MTATALRWQRDASCLDYPHHWWFPENRYLGQKKAAKEICSRCLVRQECLAFALERNEDWGIWGGFDVHKIDGFKRARCRRCGERIPASEMAALAIRGVDPREWACKRCWYRMIAERRRT